MIDDIQSDEWSSLNVESSVHPAVLVIGLGNPILGDDGVGWRVAEKVAQHFHLTMASLPATSIVESYSSYTQVEVDCLSVGGLALMERLIGYERAIIIDALSTGRLSIGTVSQIALSDMPEHALGHLCAPHDTTLQNALRLGRSMGAKIPDEIVVVGIEIDLVYNFSDELSPAVHESIPEAFNMVMELLK
jgi:hydrogenase maturation protease